MKGEELYNALLAKSGRLDAYLARVISYAYQDPMLICNPVLSRVPDASSLLFRIVQKGADRPSARPPLVKLALKIARFYLKNSLYFLAMLIHGIVFRASRLRCERDRINRQDDLILLSTFTMIDKILPAGCFVDDYFGRLYDILTKTDRQFVVLCVLFGDRPLNLKRRLETYNILAADGRNYITEFELLGSREWFALLRFIMVYPFAALRLLRKDFGEFDHEFRQELVESLDLVQCQNYVRYLIGRQLGGLTEKRLKVINWYENQVTDKLLFRGLRDAGTRARIYGCQFFIKSPLYANLNPLPEEGRHAALPDIILAPGEQKISVIPGLTVLPGISPRYSYLFNVTHDVDSLAARKGFLVLLTYDIEESQKVIDYVRRYQEHCPELLISIKLHPNHVLANPFQYPETWKTVTESVADLCLATKLVVTSGTSSALEAAVLGCSVVVIGNNHKITINPIPAFGRGKIWDLVFEYEDLGVRLGALLQYREQCPADIARLAKVLRDKSFAEATDKKIIELFELA